MPRGTASSDRLEIFLEMQFPARSAYLANDQSVNSFPHYFEESTHSNKFLTLCVSRDS